MDPKKKQLLEDSFDRVVYVGCCIIPYEDLSDIIDEDIMIFGTAKDEQLFSFNKVDELFKSQYKQLENMQPSLSRNRLHERISADENNAIIIEELRLSFGTTGDVNTIVMRASAIMEYINSVWKLTHWHASTAVETENDPWHFEEWKMEKEKLQKLVDEQTVSLLQKNRELEIEAALERVRLASMAMLRTSELKQVITTVFAQLKALNLPLDACYIDIFEENNWGLNIWVGTETDSYPQKLKLSYLDQPLFNQIKQARIQKKKESFFTVHYDKAAKDHFIRHLSSENEVVKERFDLMLQTESLDMSVAVSAHAALNVYNYRGIAYSAEQNSIIKRFSKVFQQAYTRFLDLQKAEAQAQEAKIELSLERVRAQVTAMLESADLFDIVVSMRKEFLSLGHQADYFWHMHWTPESYEMSMTSEDGNRIGMVISIPKFVHEAIPDLAEWEKGTNPICVLPLNAKQAWSYIENMNTHGSYKQADPNAPTKEDIEHIGGLTFVIARTSHGEIGYSLAGVVPEPPKSDLDTLKRFASVFDIAYKRFEDLKNAENRARETQIELSLERIRAKATSMQKSSDLLDIVVAMRKEFLSLGNDAGYFWHMKWLPDRYEKAMTSGDGNKIGMVMTLPRHIHGDIELVDQWEKGKEPTLVFPMDTETAVAYVDKMISLGDFEQVDPNAPTLDDIRHIGGLTFIMARTTHGEIGYSLEGKVANPPTESIAILQRFASTFDLAYRRFEDLKEAEKRARKAQIEIALEKVRSRSLAMHQTSELLDIIQTVNQQLKELGLDISGGAFIVINKRLNEGFYCWGAGGAGDYIEEVHIPFIDLPIYTKLSECIKKGPNFLTEYYTKEEKDTFFKHLFEYAPFNKTPISRQQELLSLNGGYARSCVVLENTSVFINNHQGKIFSEEDNRILQKMGKVFEQAYTRFQDLERAEAQAYESKIEASLERVRAMAAAMNHSDDLKQIAEEMFKELEILKIHPLRYGLAIIQEDPSNAEIWASTVIDGHYLDMLGKIPLNWHPMLKKALSAWEGQLDEVIYQLQGEELKSYYQKIGQLNQHIPELDLLLDPNSRIVQYANFFPFKTGVLYAFTVEEPSEEGKSILKRFANVFEQAHIRYDDLQKAEKQAQLIREERDRLEEALKELKATQTQLIQQEKLASLGQLTAGIAHEIKNPLNFVNNFSEVSVELIEEVRDELKAISPAPEDALELLDDISLNLKKIHEHGSRADSIVKSMLQHSRGGDGKMEPTALNGLVKEFVNLSFHGMRASKYPINVDLVYELGEDVGELSLIAEDFSRVIVNLCNNAFDAMREKELSLKQNEDMNAANYLPKLSVRTYKKNRTVHIEVEDNGPGISDEMKDKILQPFFTTKKGTQGTGLGLSITNDIIKAHGGQLNILSKRNQFTRFTITLANPY